jgi:hypothetical protein
VLGLAGVTAMVQAVPPQDANITIVDDNGAVVSGLEVGAALADGTFVPATSLPNGSYFLDDVAEKFQLEIGGTEWGKVVSSLQLPGGKAIDVQVRLSRGAAIITMPQGQRALTTHTLTQRVTNDVPYLRSGDAQLLGTSNCCIANGGIGCDDPECQTLICGQDPFCCDVAWDQLCADAAADQCRACQVGGGGCRAGGNGDECETALTAVTGDNVGSNVGNPVGADDSSCAFLDTIDEWWCWVAPCTGTATASTCNQATFDTTIAIFAGCGGAEVACNDDNGAAGCANFTSLVTWAVTSGTEYRIRVAGYNGSSGDYTLTLSCEGGGGDSNCCIANGGIGCDNPTCQATVCAADAFCCDVAWDQLCADQAAELCPDICEPAAGPCGPGAGDCCIANGTPGCDDVACCETVCALDPFCCDVAWDGICQGEAFSFCDPSVCGVSGDICDGTETPENEPDCGGIGNVGQGSNCCFANGGIGCDDPACQATVCAVDSFCCDVAWDGICAGEAADLCGPLCAGGGAPVDTVNGGCNSNPNVFSPIACGESVCGTVAQGFGFRDTDWYAFVVPAGSDQNRTFTVAANFPFVIGFVDTNNCATASALDPFATGFPGQTAEVTRCFAPGTWWAFVSVNGGPDIPCDGSAVYSATLTCGGPCTTIGACCFPDASCQDGLDAPGCAANGGTFQGVGTDCLSVICEAVCGGAGSGNCFVANGTPGCDDAECCLIVCAVDAFCCDVAWDGICAGEAAQLCGVEVPANDLCNDAVPLNIGDTVDGTTIGATVDTEAPNCPGNAGVTAGGVWYSVVGDGTTLTASTCNQAGYDTQLSVYCGECPEAGSASNCCFASGGLGCDDAECTALICAQDAFCCDVAWDGLCAGAALTQCGVCLQGSTLQCVVGLDDTPGCAGFTTLVSWCSQPGAEYLILVHGFGGAVGNFTLSVTSDGVGGCTPNVACIEVTPTGACCICLPNCTSACEVLEQAECDAAGGTYLGDGTSCDVSGTVEYSSAPALGIPDNAPAGVTDSINVGDSFSVTDVNVGLNITHTWVGDLCIEVEHGGTTVLLVQRPGANTGVDCHSGSPFGCSQDNYNIVLDDEAGANIEGQCALNLTGSFIPFGSLASFDGLDASGAWNLTVTDNGAGDLGTLNSWSLIFPDPNPVGPCDGIICDSGAPIVECAAEVVPADDGGDDHGDDDDDHGDDDDGWGLAFDGGGGGDDDDDDHSPDVGGGGCTVIVSWTASDDCGLASVTGVIDIGCDVVPVESGQEIDLTCNTAAGGNGFWWWWGGGNDDDDDDDHDGGGGKVCSALFVDGVLVIEASSAVLCVTAVDLVGNEATCCIDLCALCVVPDDDHDDDHGDDDDHRGGGGDDDDDHRGGGGDDDDGWGFVGE